MTADYKKIDNYYFRPNSTPLGQGTFGTVYKSHYSSEVVKEVAVKVIRAEKFMEDQDIFLREIEVLSQIKGNHVVQLLDAKRTANNIYIFTELCNGGDLGTLLKKTVLLARNKPLSLPISFQRHLILLTTWMSKTLLGDG